LSSVVGNVEVRWSRMRRYRMRRRRKRWKRRRRRWMFGGLGRGDGGVSWSWIRIGVGRIGSSFWGLEDKQEQDWLVWWVVMLICCDAGARDLVAEAINLLQKQIRSEK